LGKEDITLCADGDPGMKQIVNGTGTETSVMTVALAVSASGEKIVQALR
jgi:hypothetical protein